VYKRQAYNFGAQGTPTFIINGKRIGGAIPYSTLTKIIDQEMLLAE